jgi:hypothetical protein
VHNTQFETQVHKRKCAQKMCQSMNVIFNKIFSFRKNFPLIFSALPKIVIDINGDFIVIAAIKVKKS